jgi:DUF4097 and DUF4098 domain-containing protein YvlB
MSGTHRWIRAALPLLLLVTATAAPAGAKEDKKHWWSEAPEREAEPFHWAGHLDEGGTLEVHGINGNVHATLASGNRVEVEAVRRGRKDDPEDVKIEVIERGERVIVCARYPNPSGGLNDCASDHQNVQDCDVNVEFTIRVPANVTFVPRNVNGSIEAMGLQGPVMATTVNGNVDVSTTASAEAHTVNGSIDVHMGLPDGDDDVLEFETVNGKIALEVPKDVDADVDAKTANGSIHSELPVTVKSSKDDPWNVHRRLVGRIGEGGARLKMETVNGSIELAGY